MQHNLEAQYSDQKWGVLTYEGVQHMNGTRGESFEFASTRSRDQPGYSYVIHKS